MARARGAMATVSLFPFLSILVCLMGVLAFIMVAIVLISTANPDIEIKMAGQTEKTPVFVECREDQMVLHPDQETETLVQASAPGSAFQRLIDFVAADAANRYVIVFVFPKGIECFQQARDVIEDRNLDIGYEPVLDGWRLRLGASG